MPQVLIGHPGARRAVTIAQAVGLLGLTVVLASCAGSPAAGPSGPATPTDAASCSDPGDVVDLGAPFPDAAPAEFTTSGGWMVWEATRFPHGHPLDPEVGRTLVLLGPVADPPRFDPGQGSVTNATHRIELVENTPASMNLPAGTYWMVNSNGVWIAARGCATSLTHVTLG